MRVIHLVSGMALLASLTGMAYADPARSDVSPIVPFVAPMAGRPAAPAKPAALEAAQPSAETDAACDNPDAIGTSRTIDIDPAAGPLHVGLETYPQTLALADHEVVLTFDDGPAPDTTPAVLEALRHECVRATFFLIGRHARHDPQLVRREIADGHTVGHHSMTHPVATLRFLPERAALRDIDQGIAAVEAAGWPDRPPRVDRPRVPFFRFPGFADTPGMLSALDQRHIAVFGCDLWAGDWNKMTPEHERRIVMSGLDKIGHRGIILFHDTIPSTAEMLPGLLRDFKAAGYRIVALKPSETAPAPMLRAAPQGWTSATNAIIDRRRGFLQRAASRLHDLSAAEPRSTSSPSSLVAPQATP